MFFIKLRGLSGGEMGLDGSKGITRPGALPGKTESDGTTPGGKSLLAPLGGKKSPKKTLLFWLPWQNLLQGAARRRTEQQHAQPNAQNQLAEKEGAAERAGIERILKKDEAATPRKLEQGTSSGLLGTREKPEMTLMLWIGTRMQNLMEEISGDFLAERIRKGGFIMGVAGLLWYDRDKQRPASRPLSFLFHMILVVVLVWYLTHVL